MTSRLKAFAPASYGTLKDASRVLFELVGGVQRAAEFCRLKISRLSVCANPYSEGSYLPVDVVLQLEKAAGSRPVTEHMAAAHHCLLLALPTGPVAARWADDLAACAKESSDVFARLAAALANDGAVDQREAQELLRETDEALAAFAALRQHLSARLDGKT